MSDKLVVVTDEFHDVMENWYRQYKAELENKPNAVKEAWGAVVTYVEGLVEGYLSPVQLEEIARAYDGVYESQGSEIGPDLREQFKESADYTENKEEEENESGNS
jgi:hypothetical protein